ncbi:cation:proton antiporter [Gordonia sp. CPCC 205515]|uniref:cation:proton antiporter n=1 Tax=Gordonia sp. CPCC 205515 TaxID=3140791 RepID=UPI003AF40A9D
MTDAVLAVLCLLILLWAITSQLLSRHDVTGPLLFVVAGYVLANPTWGVLDVDVDTSLVHRLAELTLALVLFTDASRVDVGGLRKAVRVPARLLLIGLPLTMLLGTLGAYWCFGGIGWALALFVGASLAPTDAALSVQLINDERIPQRLRLALNVESGLNDGIATPVVTLAIALAGTSMGLSSGEHVTVGDAGVELLLGVAIGVVVGAVSAWAINMSARQGLSSASTRRIATLAVAIGVFLLALAVEGNGFIAAFVAGMTFGYIVRRPISSGSEESDKAIDDSDGTALEVLPELGGELLALMVWFLFGAALIPLVLQVVEAGDLLLMLAYAVLSLTVFRMVPVVLSLLGSGLSARDVAIVGWFGPRGLASVVFGLLGVEALAGSTAQTAVAAIGTTVFLSVIAHGVTAGPVARRYPAEAAGVADEVAEAGAVTVRSRGMLVWRHGSTR